MRYEIFWDQINQLLLAAAHYLSITFWEGTLVACRRVSLHLLLGLAHFWWAPWCFLPCIMCICQATSRHHQTLDGFEYGNGNCWEIPVEFHQLAMVRQIALHNHPKSCINFCVSPRYFHLQIILIRLGIYHLRAKDLHAANFTRLGFQDRHFH